MSGMAANRTHGLTVAASPRLPRGWQTSPILPAEGVGISLQCVRCPAWLRVRELAGIAPLNATNTLCECAVNLGEEWQQVLEAAPWSARSGHAMVQTASGGVLVISGRGNSGTTFHKDVWLTIDEGTTWTLVPGEPPWAGRWHGRAVRLPSGTIVFGFGFTNDGRNDVRLADVWASSDDGATWTQKTAEAELGPRVRNQMVALPSGEIVVAGGSSGGGGVADVWSSVDEGATWQPVTDVVDWAGRESFAMVAYPDGDILLFSGYTNTEQTVNDVWISSDGGEVWTQRDVPPWSARSDPAATLVGKDTVIMTGGLSGSLQRDAWRTSDKGLTWSLLTPSTVASAPSGRQEHAVLGLSSGTVLLTGGTSPEQRDVWRRSGFDGWADDSCGTAKRGVCDAPFGAVHVSAALPAAAGAVSPPNAASPVPATLLFAPPVPALSLEAGQAATTTVPAAVFAVVLDHPITGLRSTHFDITKPPTLSVTRTLTGSGDSYTLSLTFDTLGCARKCPAGYFASNAGTPSEDMFCVREVDDYMTATEAKAACSPYTLASPTDEQHAAAIQNAITYVGEAYWYVPQLWPAGTLGMSPHLRLACGGGRAPCAGSG